MHHLCIGELTSAAALTTDTQVPAVADTVFTVQNNNFIFTDSLRLIGADAMAASLTKANIYSPSLVPYGLWNLWPLSVSATPPSYPRLNDYRDLPMPIPMNEQIQMQAQDSAVGGEVITMAMFIAGPNWTRNRVTGNFRAILQTTLSFTTVAKGWSGPQPITFTNQPIGGWYAVNGAWMLAANCRYFRLYFPRSPTLSGRQLRPGSFTTQAAGNLEVPLWNNQLGCWGGFHTFEPLQAEVYKDAVTAITPTLFIDVDYLGQQPSGNYPVQIPGP